MKKKWLDWLIGVLIRFVYLAAATVMSCVVADLIVKIAADVFFLEGYPVPVLRVFVMLITALAVIIALSFREGYHYARFSARTLLAEAAPAVVLQFGFGFLFGFARFATGCVRNIAGWMYYGKDFLAQSPLGSADLPLWMFLLAFLITDTLYIAIMLLSQKYGKLKRLADREEILSEKSQK